MSDLSLYDIFIAGSNGQIKAYSIKNNNWEQITLPNNTQISTLCWDTNEGDIFLGESNGQILNLSTKSFVQLNTKNDSNLIGLCTYESKFITCRQSGQIIYHRDMAIEYVAGNDINTFRQNEYKLNVFATGGKENNLKIWDINQTMAAPFFTAKNQKNDWLNLRIPTWITDIAFSIDNRTTFAASSYNKIEVYDSKAQRRPVLVINNGDSPITSISVLPSQHELITGNSKGLITLLDTRGKCKIVQQYTKANGGVSKVHSDGKFVAVSSMDRYFRIFDLKSKILIYKIYLKTSPINFLMRRDFDLSRFSNVQNNGVDNISEKRKLKSIAMEISTNDDDNNDDLVIAKRLKSF